MPLRRDPMPRAAWWSRTEAVPAQGGENLERYHSSEYREPYPTWIVAGMDLLAAGILIASFRDAWSVVSSLGQHAAVQNDWSNSVVAGAVVLAIDASILLLEQARSQIKLRGGDTRYNDIWVFALITLSAILNVRYLTMCESTIDSFIGGILGIAIPSTIAVLGFLKGDMLAYNARHRQRVADDLQYNQSTLVKSAVPPVVMPTPATASTVDTHASPETIVPVDSTDRPTARRSAPLEESGSPMFRLQRESRRTVLLNP